NIKSAVENNLKWKHLGCLAHTLNLIVKDGFKCSDEINLVITKTKTIVGFFKRSSTANLKLIEYQRNQGTSQPLKLLQDTPTRWNSTFYMLERFLQLEEAIKTTIALCNADLPLLSFTEWSILKQLCQILKPFEMVTKDFSGDSYETASIVLTLVNGLKK
ncbi:zinc finger BED domain-containing protein 4-like, partial [Rhagoletis pomonella]|uniref:zinc finger BED domain-containing protein 4-like n=1 Tax=Rhagoletis pomonella TaxID=28610 RepID=UPI001783A559